MSDEAVVELRTGEFWPDGLIDYLDTALCKSVAVPWRRRKIAAATAKMTIKVNICQLTPK
jgi:hypothetical protein